ncbi:hypothetical protein A1D22_09495 [Pasteurellaceae bacterium LFhippo2]|nr:hypothetical protein [Pasteurellaceae bacterium LFhippo2]
MADIYLSPFIQQTDGLIKLVNDLMLLEQTAGNYRPDTIGNWGAFEENPSAMLAGIKKVHIAVSDEDFEKWKKKTGQNRKSDNYLVYAQHDLEIDTFLILDFITPDAHKRIKSKLPDLVLCAEEFQESYSTKLAEKFTKLEIE